MFNFVEILSLSLIIYGSWLQPNAEITSSGFGQTGRGLEYGITTAETSGLMNPRFISNRKSPGGEWKVHHHNQCGQTSTRTEGSDEPLQSM